MYDRLGMGLTRPYGLIDGFLLSMATLETYVGHSPPVQKVSDLITSSRQWNFPLISALFAPKISELILHISLGLAASPDRLILSLDSKSSFSVKSAYKLAYSLSPTAHSFTIPNSNPQFWKKIWKAKVSRKVRVCVWKACTNILPIRARLADRHVPIATLCILCDGALETRAIPMQREA